MDKTNYVYGYEMRGKQKVPTYTVAIVPEEHNGHLYFGIGLSICADNDVPIKAYGRNLAAARANGALTRRADIESKARKGDFADFQTLGMRTPWDDAHVSILDFELPSALTSRIYKAIRYMKQHFVTPTA